MFLVAVCRAMLLHTISTGERAPNGVVLMLEHKRQIPAKVPEKLIKRCQAAAAKEGIPFAKYMENLMQKSTNTSDFEYLVSQTLLDISEKISEQGGGEITPATIEILLLCRAIAKASLVKEIQSVMRQNNIFPVEV